MKPNTLQYALVASAAMLLVLSLVERATAQSGTSDQCRHYVVDDTFDLHWSGDRGFDVPFEIFETTPGESKSWDVAPTTNSEVVISVDSTKNAPVDVLFSVVNEFGFLASFGMREDKKKFQSIGDQLSLNYVKKGQRSYSPLPSTERWGPGLRYRVTVWLKGKGDVPLLQKMSDTLRFPVRVRIFISPADVDERIRRACCIEGTKQEG
jgi:hypothetical protein